MPEDGEDCDDSGEERFARTLIAVFIQHAKKRVNAYSCQLS